MGWDGMLLDQARRRAALIGAGCVILIGGGKVALGAVATDTVSATSSLSISTVVAVVALIVAAASWVGARRAQREAVRASDDLDAASQRLIAMENGLLNLAARLKAVQAGADTRPLPAPVVSPELNVEIGLLGGLLKDIAETVAVHDRSLETLASEMGSLQREVAEAKPASLASAPVQAATVEPKPPLAAARAAPAPATSVRETAPAVQRPERAEPVASPAFSLPAFAQPPQLSPAATQPVLPARVAGTASAPVQSSPLQPAVSERREPTFAPPETSSQPAPAAHPREPRAAETAPRRADMASQRIEAVSQRVEDVAATLVDAAREEAIVAAAAQGRIELHLQPVVTLPQRRVRFYETLSRLRLADGALMGPAEFLPVLERRGLAANFDEKAFTRVVQVARHLAGREGDAGVSFNLCAASVAEPGFLRALDRILAAHADVAGRIILEVPQRLLRGLDLERLGMLSVLVGRGVRLCVDRAVDLRIDAMSLAERGVRFLKLPVSLLLGADAARADIHVEDMAALLARAGVVLIAEKIEREEEVRDLLDLDVPMAQGFLFSPPRPVRSDVLTGLDSDSVAEPPPHRNDDDQSEGSERKPFRAFLRRAGV